MNARLNDRPPSGLSRALKVLRRDRYLVLMFLPVMAYYIIFSFMPMTGIYIAFTNYKPGGGMYGGAWVGLRWFREFFASPFSYRVIRNTVLISLYSILFGFPAPILFAICVSEIRHEGTRRVVQTVSYLPHFISTVVLVGLLSNMLNTNTGIVNNMIEWAGGQRINFMMSPRWFRTLHVASGVWQSFGYGSIIYIAAIFGIDPSLYEAAKMDGIGKFQEVYYITLPMISQTIIILFIMRLGGLMSVGFEKVFLMYNSAVYETADTIATYLYRKGIESSNYSYATAMGLFNSLVNFAFVVTANTICRKLTDASLW